MNSKIARVEMRFVRRCLIPFLVLWAGRALAGEPGSEMNAIRGFEGLYDSLGRFAAERSSCVVLIDPTDPSDLPKNLAAPGGLWRLACLRSRITALSGLDCYCFH